MIDNIIIITVVGVISFLIGITIGLHIALPIFLKTVKIVENGVYNKAVSETLENLNRGNNKKNK